MPELLPAVVRHDVVTSLMRQYCSDSHATATESNREAEDHSISRVTKEGQTKRVQRKSNGIPPDLTEHLLPTLRFMTSICKKMAA